MLPSAIFHAKRRLENTLSALAPHLDDGPLRQLRHAQRDVAAWCGQQEAARGLAAQQRRQRLVARHRLARMRQF